MTSLVHVSTSLLRSRSQFLHLVNRLQDICKGHTLLYSISHDAPDLEQSVKQLSTCAKETIGCLSGPLPLERDHPFFSCSVAVFRKDTCRPFSLLKTGGGPTQVGRWHAFRRKESDGIFDGLGGQSLDADINWEELWNTKSSALFLPQELKDATNTRSLVYFSDNSSWDLATALREYIPQAHQLGIVASSTPFVTGQPFTLLRNGKAQSTGAVGIALQSCPSNNVLKFNGLVQLTPSLPVRRAEGNLVHELGESLPARVLFKAIQDRGLPDDQAKYVDYYIGIRAATASEKTHPRLLRIVAGSPSRGSIAVEDVAAPPVGSLLEFYYRPHSSSVQLPSELSPTHATASDALLGALVDNPESSYSGSSSSLFSPKPDEPKEEHQDTFKSFLVSTEHGFVFSSESQGKMLDPWKCTVPSTFGGLYFPVQ